MSPAQNTLIDVQLDSASRQARIAKLRLIFERIRTRARVPVEPLVANEKAAASAKEAPVIEPKALASPVGTTGAAKPPKAAAEPVAPKKSAYQIAEPITRTKPEAAKPEAIVAKALEVAPPQPVPVKPSFARTEPIVTMKPEPESAGSAATARAEHPHRPHSGEPESERTIRVDVPDVVLAEKPHEEAVRKKEREGLGDEELRIDHTISQDETASEAQTQIRQAPSSLLVPTPENPIAMPAPAPEAKVVAHSATKSTEPKSKRGWVGAVLVILVLTVLAAGGLWLFWIRHK